MIITQSIRGAGYFNSGFILIVFLLIFSYIKFHKLNKYGSIIIPCYNGQKQLEKF